MSECIRHTNIRSHKHKTANELNNLISRCGAHKILLTTVKKCNGYRLWIAFITANIRSHLNKKYCNRRQNGRITQGVDISKALIKRRIYKNPALEAGYICQSKSSALSSARENYFLPFKTLSRQYIAAILACS